MAKFLPKPKNPIIDWNNSLCRGLIFEMPLFEYGKSVIERLTNHKGIITGTTGVIKNTRVGAGFNLASTNDVVDFTTSTKQNGSLYLTVEALVNSSSSNINGSRIFNKYTGATIVWLGIENEVTGGVNRIGFRYRWSGALAEWASADGSMTGLYDQPVHIIVTYNGTSSSNTPNFYINGVKSTTQTITSTSGTIQADGSALGIGNRPNTASQTNAWIGDIYYGRYWNRILSDREIKILYSNPWAIYKSYPMYKKLNSIFASTPTVVASTIRYWRNLMGVGI